MSTWDIWDPRSPGWTEVSDSSVGAAEAGTTVRRAVTPPSLSDNKQMEKKLLQFWELGLSLLILSSVLETSNRWAGSIIDLTVTTRNFEVF